MSLNEVVENFEIFGIQGGGNEGIVYRPSKEELDTAFSSSLKKEEYIQRILKEGTINGHHLFDRSQTLFQSKKGNDAGNSSVHG